MANPNVRYFVGNNSRAIVTNNGDAVDPNNSINPKEQEQVLANVQAALTRTMDELQTNLIQIPNIEAIIGRDIGRDIGNLISLKQINDNFNSSLSNFKQM